MVYDVYAGLRQLLFGIETGVGGVEHVGDESHVCRVACGYGRVVALGKLRVLLPGLQFFVGLQVADVVGLDCVQPPLQKSEIEVFISVRKVSCRTG